MTNARPRRMKTDTAFGMEKIEGPGIQYRYACKLFLPSTPSPNPTNPNLKEPDPTKTLVLTPLLAVQERTRKEKKKKKRLRKRKKNPVVTFAVKERTLCPPLGIHVSNPIRQGTR